MKLTLSDTATVSLIFASRLICVDPVVSSRFVSTTGGGGGGVDSFTGGGAISSTGGGGAICSMTGLGFGAGLGGATFSF